jgi:hypothetical protein
MLDRQFYDIHEIAGQSRGMPLPLPSPSSPPPLRMVTVPGVELPIQRLHGSAFVSANDAEEKVRQSQKRHRLENEWKGKHPKRRRTTALSATATTTTAMTTTTTHREEIHASQRRYEADEILRLLLNNNTMRRQVKVADTIQFLERGAESILAYRQRCLESGRLPTLYDEFLLFTRSLGSVPVDPPGGGAPNTTTTTAGETSDYALRQYLINIIMAHWRVIIRTFTSANRANVRSFKQHVLYMLYQMREGGLLWYQRRIIPANAFLYENLPEKAKLTFFNIEKRLINKGAKQHRDALLFYGDRVPYEELQASFSAALH